MIDINNIQGLAIEEVKAVFFDENALREAPYILHRIDMDGYRYYYIYEDDRPVFCPSVTTLLKKVLPTPQGLLEWIRNNGADADRMRDTAAAYGTLMHMVFEKLVIDRRLYLEKLPDMVRNYMEGKNLPESFFGESLHRLRKDVLSFAQFVREWGVRPLAVEIGLYHPVYKYAGCLDLPCVMTDPRTGETFRAIVDFKSGRKGFYEEHELQLHLYMWMWNETFKDAPVGRVFNFAPKDWRGKPTYTLKEQTDSPNASKLEHLLALSAIENGKRDNSFTLIGGVLDLDNGNLDDNLLQVSLEEFVMMHDGRELPPRETVPGEKPSRGRGRKSPRSTQKRPTRATRGKGGTTTPPAAGIASTGQKTAKNGASPAKPETPAPDKGMEALLGDDIQGF